MNLEIVREICTVFSEEMSLLRKLKISALNVFIHTQTTYYMQTGMCVIVDNCSMSAHGSAQVERCECFVW